MHIHHYMQFFTGANSPGSHQPRRLVMALAARGHTIDVVACDMNAYSEQTEMEEMIEHESGGQIRVHRLPVARCMRRNLKSRLKTYLGFAWEALKHSSNLAAPDVIIASIQPLFTGLVGIRNAHKYKVPLLLEIRDLWPDALEAKGAVTGLKARGLYALANYIYARADRIVCLTPGIKVEMVKKGFNSNRIDVLPNGFDPELFQQKENRRDKLRSELGWTDHFVALYTGTHTEVTAIHIIVKAAAVLKDHPHIRFDLFGKGQTKAAAIELADSLKLNNIYFHDPVPRIRIPDLIEACDVGLMTLFTSRLEHIYFENKFVDYMGAGRSIVAAMGGQQAEIISRHKTGKVVPAFDYEGLAMLVKEAFENPDEFRILGSNGRKLVENNLMLPQILDRYCQRVEDLQAGKHNAIAWEPVL